jgi:hypothetical protein
VTRREAIGVGSVVGSLIVAAGARSNMTMSEHVRGGWKWAQTPLFGQMALVENVHVAHGPRIPGRGNVCDDFFGGAMTNSDYPWEPLAGTEAEHLAGAGSPGGNRAVTCGVMSRT